MASLFEKLGKDRAAEIEGLHRAKAIVAIHHGAGGAYLIMRDGSQRRIDGLSKDDAMKMVGWLGFFGEDGGLGLPAFAVKPITS